MPRYAVQCEHPDGRRYAVTIEAPSESEAVATAGAVHTARSATLLAEPRAARTPESYEPTGPEGIAAAPPVLQASPVSVAALPAAVDRTVDRIVMRLFLIALACGGVVVALLVLKAGYEDYREAAKWDGTHTVDGSHKR